MYKLYADAAVQWQLLTNVGRCVLQKKYQQEQGTTGRREVSLTPNFGTRCRRGGAISRQLTLDVPAQLWQAAEATSQVRPIPMITHLAARNLLCGEMQHVAFSSLVVQGSNTCIILVTRLW